MVIVMRTNAQPAALGRMAQIVMIGALIAGSPPETGWACGYHDDVSLARGVLNWVYPDALHVVGAYQMGEV